VNKVAPEGCSGYGGGAHLTMFDVDQLNLLIRSRRTVKPAAYTDQIIPREVVDTILENGNWAPNHRKTEPWRFRVYAGEARAELAEALVALYEQCTPPESQRADKLEKLDKNPRRASHAIALFMARHGGGAPTKIPEIEEVEAVACAGQNMQLTAHAHGLGAFWSTGPMTYDEAATARVFGLEPGWRYLGVLFLGVPAEAPPEGVRTPVSEKTEWVGESA